MKTEPGALDAREERDKGAVDVGAREERDRGYSRCGCDGRVSPRVQ